MTDALAVSRLVNVQVNLTPPLAQFPNLNTCLLLGTSNVIDVKQRMREYNDIDSVAVDFGTSAPEYLAALLWFAQAPMPTSLLIGRWANADTHGLLVGGPVATANRLASAWSGITTGTFAINVNGSGVHNITALNFSAVGNLNNVATVINAALVSASVAASVAWDATQGRFTFTTTADGDGSTVAFLTATGTGADVSNMLAGRATSSGAYVADGVDAQTAIETVAIFQDKFSSQWYALVVPDADDDDHEAIAAFCQASDPTHFYGITSAEGGIITTDDTSNIAYLLQQANITKAAVQYSSTSLYAVMSLLARILTTNWNANQSTITLMYKNEPLVTAEHLTATEMNALLACNANVFVAYNNNTAIIQPGITPGDQYIDTVIGCDWLRYQIQTLVYNLLYGSTTKIPQTDAGINQIVAQVTAALQAGVNNGLIAPGQWNAGGFGQLVQGQFLPTGYYVYAPPIASQSENDRQARKSVPIQVAAKLAGAVQTVDVIVNVNQ